MGFDLIFFSEPFCSAALVESPLLITHFADKCVVLQVIVSQPYFLNRGMRECYDRKFRVMVQLVCQFKHD